MNEAKISKYVKPLRFFGHWNNEGMASIENTGKTAKLTFDGRHEKPYILTGGLLNHGGRYIFENLHFHWGDKDGIGSEHKINGKT